MEKRLDDLEDKTSERLCGVKAHLENLKETATSMPRETDVKETIKSELVEVTGKIHDEVQMNIREEFSEATNTMRDDVEQLVKTSIKVKLNTSDQDKWQIEVND